MTELLPQQRLRAHDDLWVALLQSNGFLLNRNTDAWVSYDGRGTISVAPDELLDADDCLAQIVLHELCHHWVEGDASRGLADWGLDNTNDQHVAHEHAALVVQASLADRFGLRSVLVATTDFRPWYEALADNPEHGLAPDVESLARAGLQRALGSSTWKQCVPLLQAAAELLGGDAPTLPRTAP